MTSPIAVVLNPVAGRGAATRLRPRIEQLLSVRAAGGWKIFTTTAPGEATAIAARCAAEGYELVAAAGGDGTLSEVMNGVIGTPAALGLLPVGTGNDFARTVGLYGDLDRAVDTLLQGDPRPIDVGCVRGRWFLNIAGCGFDAVVAQRTNNGPRFLTGTAAYLLAVLQTLATYRAAALRLTADGETIFRRAMMCSVANARTYGGGMRIAPDAQLDDGLFDVCLLAEAGTVEFLRAFPQVFRGTHVSHPKITMLRARSVTIETDPPLPVLIDGDVAAPTPVTFTIQPAALRFQFPCSAAR